MYERTLTDLSVDFLSQLYGTLDTNLRAMEDAFAVSIHCRDGGVKVQGGAQQEVDQACACIQQLQRLSAISGTLDMNSVQYVISMIREDRGDELSALYSDCICLTSKGKPVKARTVGQRRYVDAIRENTLVFGIGPAGTGKTFLAVAMAVTALKQKQVSRIVLTRPAVEAGEKLGFLPGDLQSKIDPYLRPLYDALGELLGGESAARSAEKGVLEICPLAYMRGRTLDDAFIILDEAQNTTPEQMKMFLTRLGNNSKAVVTGDVTQIDLPHPSRSGLVEAIDVLKNIKDIEIFRFTRKDIVRHPLVQKIIEAYESRAPKGNKQ
ncbi:MAG: PhoH family protein [Oscillospiraceae bacterium]|nr:PhoH family protein [Oscillospiraceae bacterium]